MSDNCLEKRRFLVQGCCPLHGWYWLARTRSEAQCQLEGDCGWLVVYQHNKKVTRKATELLQYFTLAFFGVKVSHYLVIISYFKIYNDLVVRIFAAQSKFYLYELRGWKSR